MVRKMVIVGMSALFLFTSVVGAQKVDSFTSFGAYWEHRTDQFRRLPNPEREICFLGDSITDGCEWRELTGIERVTNRGIGGDTAWGVLARLDEVTEGKPDRIFLMIGTNDLARGKTVAQVSDKIAEVLDTIKKQSPQTTVYLQSVLPTDEQFAPTYKNENIDPLNEELKKLAAEKNVTWVDLVPLFKGGNGKLKGELSEDGLHLNGKGYYLWYSAIRKYLW